MKWFQISTKYLRDISTKKSEREKLEDALNVKYGDYDYTQDARSLNDVQFEEEFLKIVNENLKKPKSETKILVTGANNGYEYNLLQDFNVTSFDLSKKALEKLRVKFPNTEIVQGNSEELPFKDGSFDIYISMRSIHSSNINLEKALTESLRVTTENGVLVYSVSNGYLIDGKLVKGMYDYPAEEIEVKKPYIITEKIKRFLISKNIKTEVVEIPSEIVIIAKK